MNGAAIRFPIDDAIIAAVQQGPVDSWDILKILDVDGPETDVDIKNAMNRLGRAGMIRYDRNLKKWKENT